jgi:cell fate (sporulation/competence/biofilm development) regulator YmcA (YheA/YmcA/DUF963 family)
VGHGGDGTTHRVEIAQGVAKVRSGDFIGHLNIPNVVPKSAYTQSGTQKWKWLTSKIRNKMKCIEKYRKVSKSIEKYRKVSKSIEKYRKVSKSIEKYEKYPKVSKSIQKYRKVSKSTPTTSSKITRTVAARPNMDN